MKKIKAFFYIYKNSLASPKYYQDLNKVNFAFSLKYFIVLAFIASVLTSINAAYHKMPKARQIADNMLTEIAELFPDDLTITMKSGKWEISKEEPFTIAFPKSLQTGEFDFPKNIITFYHNGKINDIESFDTLILINDVNIIVKNNQGRTDSYPLETVSDGQITKMHINQIVQSLQGIADALPIFLFVFIIIGAFFYYFIFMSIYLVIFGLILTTISMIKKNKAAYGLNFRIGVHSVTLPITIEVLLSIPNINPVNFYLLGFFVVHLIFATIILININTDNKTNLAK